jgi:hypothetical protein
MDASSVPAVRAALLSMYDPTDRGIINVVEQYLSSTANNTMIINASKPHLDKHIDYVNILYIDVECLSWSELNNIIDHFPLLQCLIIRVNSLIGGTNRLLNLIDNSNLRLFIVLVNGAHCSTIVNSSIFLRDWSAHVPNETLHVYYQRDPYNHAVYELLDKTQLDNLLVLNCHRPMEPIESIIQEVLEAALKVGLHYAVQTDRD